MEAPKLAQDILDDSGYKSRKYVALYVFWALVIAGFAVAVLQPTIERMAAVATLLPIYYGALGVGLAAYFGVNASQSFAAAKAAKLELPPKPPVESDSLLPKPPL